MGPAVRAVGARSFGCPVRLRSGLQAVVRATPSATIERLGGLMEGGVPDRLWRETGLGKLWVETVVQAGTAQCAWRRCTAASWFLDSARIGVFCGRFHVRGVEMEPNVAVLSRLSVKERRLRSQMGYGS
jgi:hypothetical protein